MLQLAIASTAISFVGILGLSTILLGSGRAFSFAADAGSTGSEAGGAPSFKGSVAVVLGMVVIASLVGGLATLVSSSDDAIGNQPVRIWSTGSSIR